ETCTLTVCSARCSSAAISLFSRPRRTRFRTSVSRGVRRQDDALTRDSGELGPACSDGTDDQPNDLALGRARAARVAMCANLLQALGAPAAREDRDRRRLLLRSAGAHRLRRTELVRPTLVRRLPARPCRAGKANGGPAPDRGLPLALVQLAGLGCLRRGDLRSPVAHARRRPRDRLACEARRGV